MQHCIRPALIVASCSIELALKLSSCGHAGEFPLQSARDLAGFMQRAHISEAFQNVYGYLAASCAAMAAAVREGRRLGTEQVCRICATLASSSGHHELLHPVTANVMRLFMCAGDRGCVQVMFLAFEPRAGGMHVEVTISPRHQSSCVARCVKL